LKRKCLLLISVILGLLWGARPIAAEEGCGANNQSGYYEGTASSHEAGELKVSLNLICADSGYAGQFITPVGKFDVLSGSSQAGHLVLKFGADGDQGTLEAEVTEQKLSGKFVFGTDSGPVDLVRRGESKRPGFDTPTLDLPAARWREDLHYFAAEVPKQHANAFYHLSRQEFDAAVAKADHDLDHMNGDEAYVAIDRIANTIGDGHTFVMWPDDLSKFPIDVRLFDGDYRVAGVLPGNERALGARIVKVGDWPLEKVLEALRTLTPAAETKILADIRIEDFLSIGMLLHGLGIIKDRNAATYTLSDTKGKQFTLTLHGQSMSAEMMVKWVRPFRERPLYLQNRSQGLWCEHLDKWQTLYCSFRNYDHLQENAAHLFSAIGKRHPSKVVIDMRLNLGGDYTLGEKYLIDPLLQMPDINKRGHLFVLISAYTFSAGMSNAAQFRSKTTAILLGQTIGERPNSYQEARELRLPNSHLIVRVSTRFYKFADGDENLVRPDKEIPLTWKDYAAGTDAVLEAAEQYKQP